MLLDERLIRHREKQAPHFASHRQRTPADALRFLLATAAYLAISCCIAAMRLPLAVSICLFAVAAAATLGFATFSMIAGSPKPAAPPLVFPRRAVPYAAAYMLAVAAYAVALCFQPDRLAGTLALVAASAAGVLSFATFTTLETKRRSVYVGRAFSVGLVVACLILATRSADRWRMQEHLQFGTLGLTVATLAALHVALGRASLAANVLIGAELAAAWLATDAYPNRQLGKTDVAVFMGLMALVGLLAYRIMRRPPSYCSPTSF
ncbi:MAG TPA: hypothetical protein VFW87_03800 [Pirellulales bacterium]|nr:hypothetical protein [Pirellulales bacterium]